MCLAQGYNAVTPVRLESAVPRSRVKHSTTEPVVVVVVVAVLIVGVVVVVVSCAKDFWNLNSMVALCIN